MEAIYKGIVYITVLNNHRRVFEKIQHNGALEGLQEAFAKMLTGYTITELFPSYIIGNSASGITPKINITGLKLSRTTDNIRCAEFNALIPCDDATAITMLGYTYTLYSKGSQRLAKFQIDTSDLSNEQIATLDKVGLQINIRWQMYLQGDNE